MEDMCSVRLLTGDSDRVGVIHDDTRCTTADICKDLSLMETTSCDNIPDSHSRQCIRDTSNDTIQPIGSFTHLQGDIANKQNTPNYIAEKRRYSDIIITQTNKDTCAVVNMSQCIARVSNNVCMSEPYDLNKQLNDRKVWLHQHVEAPTKHGHCSDCPQANVSYRLVKQLVPSEHSGRTTSSCINLGNLVRVCDSVNYKSISSSPCDSPINGLIRAHVCIKKSPSLPNYPAMYSPDSPRRGVYKQQVQDIDGINISKLTEIKSNDTSVTTGKIKTTISSHSIKARRSQWSKLRTAVHATAIVRHDYKKKKFGTIQRDDSFLRKFSTRNYRARSVGSTESDEEGGKETMTYIYPEEMESTTKRTTKITVLRPEGSFFFYWMAVVTIAILYNFWTCIAREAFTDIQRNSHATWIILDIVADTVYILDIVVQFRTGYLEQGLMVYDSSKLSRKYMRTLPFYMDLLSVIPLDLIQFGIGVHPMIRFPRFLKFYRMYYFIYMLESRTTYPNLFRVSNLTHVLLLGAHWFAAFYFIISQAEDYSGDWTYPKPIGEYASVTKKYLHSLYWSVLTITTIGDLPPPVSNWEYTFVIVSYLIGVFVFATIVGQVGNVITNRNACRHDFEKMLDGTKSYMRRHTVPKDMRKRVMRWYDYVWSRGRMNGGWDLNSLGLLPDKLKTELAIHVNLDTLKKVTIFQECQPEFLHDLVLKMKAYIFTPGDLICRHGEVAREMFIIADGVVEVISEKGTVLTQMSTGDFFGEIGILNLDSGINRRSADVRSVGYSELFVLSRDDVLSALKDNPEAEKLLRDYGHKRLDAIRKLAKANNSPWIEDDHTVQNGRPKQNFADPPTQVTDLLSNKLLHCQPELKRARSAPSVDSTPERQPLEMRLIQSIDGCKISPALSKYRITDIQRRGSTCSCDSQAVPQIVVEPASPDHDAGGYTLGKEDDRIVARIRELLGQHLLERTAEYELRVRSLESKCKDKDMETMKLNNRLHKLQMEVVRLRQNQKQTSSPDSQAEPEQEETITSKHSRSKLWNKPK